MSLAPIDSLLIPIIYKSFSISAFWIGNVINVPFSFFSDLDERTSRTPRNLNETKRSGRTNKKIEHWISFKDLIEKALIFSGAENFDDKICWEDFEAPEWCVPIKANVLTFEWDITDLYLNHEQLY
ncbi:hypothetical protein RhiirA5_417918 [Rhizophagus irregularis]|uniref:Uncharacterized protein n=1 Tax=Rhizophagus irregularis TaxID=588596 RepID=A0A2N0PLF4_9GLOM|nr:hypothetical protein RhiirA5_417918 [Rhizophagus irregularis]